MPKHDELNFKIASHFKLSYQDFATPTGYALLKAILLKEGYEVTEYYHPCKGFGTVMFLLDSDFIQATAYHSHSLPESLLLAIKAVVLE